MKKDLIKDKDQDKKMPDKKAKDKDKVKAKKKGSRAPVKEVREPRLPVSDSNSGYIPFGG